MVEAGILKRIRFIRFGNYTYIFAKGSLKAVQLSANEH